MKQQELHSLVDQHHLTPLEADELGKCSANIERAAAEIAARPKVLPLDQRHQYSPAELEELRRQAQSGELPEHLRARMGRLQSGRNRIAELVEE